jgi:GAF domain-containing protein
MSQPDLSFSHTILERLDATIEQYENTMKELTDTLPNATTRKSKSILVQLRREVLSVREEAISTLTRLNTFGATLQTMAHPEAGVQVVLDDVLKWFLLLTECERTFISLYDPHEKEFVMSVDIGWMDADLRPMEHGISEVVLKEVKQSRDIFSSSNVDMASDSYQKSGSWQIPLRSVFGVPLLWEDELIGIFYGDRKITSGVLSRDMFPLLKLYAAQAAIAIHNAQLFATLKEEKGQS